MPSNNTKYTQEMRDQTAEYVLRSGKSATSAAEELGIDTNTVCRCQVFSSTKTAILGTVVRKTIG